MSESLGEAGTEDAAEAPTPNPTQPIPNPIQPSPVHFPDITAAAGILQVGQGSNPAAYAPDPNIPIAYPDPTKGNVAGVVGYVGPLLQAPIQSSPPPATCGVLGLGNLNCPGVVGVNGALTFEDPDAAGDGVFGFGSINGVHGIGTSGTGVGGSSTSGDGVFGKTTTGVGVHGQSLGSGMAGKFEGAVEIDGTTSLSGDVNIKGDQTVSGTVAVTGDQTVSGTVSVTGDILLANADCAEEFDVSSESDIEPGTVVSLDDHGALCPSSVEYDSRVVGVVSGAGQYRPAIVLDRQIREGPRVAIALLGKVFCKVDADYAPVAVGDLLTTAPSPGYAMKASDVSRSFGAVIGKALGTLDHGRGVIPILVTLR